MKAGAVWLISGPASVFREEIPLGVLSDAAALHLPPAEISATALLPQNLPVAWTQSVTTAAAISQALSVVHERPLPWAIVRAAINGAIRSRLLERTADSGPWPCDWPRAANVHLRVPEEVPPTSLPPLTPSRKHAEAELESSELQDLVEGLPDVVKAGVGLNLRFVLRLELGEAVEPTSEQMARLNDALAKACAKFKFGD